MKRSALLAALILVPSQQVEAYRSIPQDGRAAFRKAVEDYQMFVVPHCAPDEVEAYVAARAERDRAFVLSLHKTNLAKEYRKAVADRADRDRHTVYECLGPPPPPPPPGVEPSPNAEDDVRHPDTTAEHFAAGDRQFATMVGLRDDLIGHPRQ